MTFIIDIDGEITHVFESFLSHNYHINSVMKVLQQESEEDVDEVSEDEE